MAGLHLDHEAHRQIPGSGDFLGEQAGTDAAVEAAPGELMSEFVFFSFSFSTFLVLSMCPYVTHDFMTCCCIYNLM